VSKDVRIRGYILKPKGTCEQKSLGKAALGLLIVDAMQAHTLCEVCFVELLSNTLWNICCALTKTQLLV